MLIQPDLRRTAQLPANQHTTHAYERLTGKPSKHAQTSTVEENSVTDTALNLMDLNFV